MNKTELVAAVAEKAEIKIAASVVPAFKAGKAFKDATNK